MKLSHYDFDFNPDLIAKYPEINRDDARLLVVHRDTGEVEHKLFKDIIDYFEEGDTFVLNDTKVFPARLYGNKEKTGAEIEVFLLRELNRELKLWDVLVDPARKIRIGVRPVDHAIFEFNLALGQKVVDEFIHRDLHAQIAQEHDRADALAALGIISRFIDSLYL